MNTNDEACYQPAESLAMAELSGYAALCGFFLSLGKDSPDYAAALRFLESAGKPYTVGVSEYTPLHTIWRQAVLYRYRGEDFMALDDAVREMIRRAPFASVTEFKNALLCVLAGATVAPEENVATAPETRKDVPAGAVVLAFRRRTLPHQAAHAAANASDFALAAQMDSDAASCSTAYECDAAGVPVILTEEHGRLLLRSEWSRRPVRLRMTKGDEDHLYVIVPTADPQVFRVEIPLLKRRTLFAGLSESVGIPGAQLGLIFEEI